MQWDMWMSLVLHHTLPLGVTVTLHHTYLVTKTSFVELLPVQLEAHRLEVQEEGKKAWRGLHAAMPSVAGQTLDTTCLGGYIELPISPLELFLSVPLSLQLL